MAGLLVGGVGGRVAMLLLRLTSDPRLRGLETDDGFTIGVSRSLRRQDPREFAEIRLVVGNSRRCLSPLRLALGEGEERVGIERVDEA